MPLARAAAATDVRRDFPIWVFPITLLAVGFVCGFGLSRVEIGDGSPIHPLTYGGDADAARTLASTVLGGVVSITTLTLTITVVTLQLASSQYSPRLMKRYSQDRSIQVTTAYFFFVFAYVIPVLFHIRSGQDAASRYVPGLALSALIVLAVLMLVGLIYFVYHVTLMVRVENMLDEIADQAVRVLETSPQIDEHDSFPEIPEDATVVTARRSGFLIEIDSDELVSRLGADDRIWFDCGVGDYVVEHAPLARYRGDLDRSAVAAALDRTVRLEAERDDQYEFAYGLRQVADIGVRALSPGVNDPTTAIVSVHVATRVLAAAAEAATVRSASVDAGVDIGAVVVVPRPVWSDLVAATFDQFATYGSSDAQVVRAMLRSLEILISLAPSQTNTTRLSESVAAIDLRLDAETFTESDRTAFSASLDGCRRLLERHPDDRLDVMRAGPGTI